MQLGASTGPYSPPPTVIVPVYNAPTETEACIRAVIRETRHPYHILVLDDASSDPIVQPLLRDLAKDNPTLRLHRHPHNLGFAANVNYGMKLADGDVVLLNSDTVVSRAWLDKLVACAYSRPNVATVTPLSNAAGAFSVPKNNRVNGLPERMSVNMFAELVAGVAAPLPVAAPTGNGFCLYIRRAALDQLGFFDEASFPHVGEENDFCQRAINAGFHNLVDSSCFVYHALSASFSSEEDKRTKLVAARQIIDERFPSYKRQVREFLLSTELDALRARLRMRLSTQKNTHEHERPRVLSLIHGGSGGMVHTNRDLMRALYCSFDTFELRCGVNNWSLVRYGDEETIAEWRFGESWRSSEGPDVPRRMAVRSIVSVFHIDLIHIRTLIGTGPELLANLAGLSIPLVLSFHDFATVCPTIQLIDDKSAFCGGHCTRSKGDCRVPLKWFTDIGPLKHQGVYRWRERMAAHLPLADAFVTTAASTRDLLLEHFPALSDRRFALIEHGRDQGRYKQTSVPPGPTLRVVAFGAFNVSKGIGLMEAIFRSSLADAKDVEFHVLGNHSSVQRLKFANVFYHGPYDREALPEHLEKISASYALVCSIWPETYCHTLTEAWMSGLPVIASDIGVIAERVRRHGGGRLVDPLRPEQWLETIKELRSSSAWRELHTEVLQIKFRNTEDMAKEYEELYRTLLC